MFMKLNARDAFGHPKRFNSAKSAGFVGSGNDVYTKLLLHMDSDFTDGSVGKSETHAPTVTGATISNTFVKFGTYSGFFGSTLQNVTFPDSVDFDLETVDYTIDFWVYPLQLLTNSMLMGQSSGNADGKWFIYTYDNGRLGIGISGASELAAPAGTISVGSWQHFAITKNGSTTKIRKNGAIVATGTGTYINNVSTVFRLGGYDAARLFNGYLDEVRISKGIDRTTDTNDYMYNTNGTTFIPPTQAYV